MATAGAVLSLGEGQMCRPGKFEAGGGGALTHKACGRESNRRLNAGIRKYAVELVRGHYADFRTDHGDRSFTRKAFDPGGSRDAASMDGRGGLWLVASSVEPSISPGFVARVVAN